MDTIAAPHRTDDYADRGIDCQFALEPAFQALAHRAEAAGWTEDEVSAALLQLAGAHIKGIMADRQTSDEIKRASRLNTAP